MPGIIEVKAAENNTTDYLDLVRHDCPSESPHGSRINSFTIMPVLNPTKALFRVEVNGEEKWTDLEIGLEIEYPFPLPDPWMVEPGKSLIIQIRSSEAGVNVKAVGKIIGFQT